jgi:hypothetical protein
MDEFLATHDPAHGRKTFRGRFTDRPTVSLAWMRQYGPDVPHRAEKRSCH